MSNGVRRAAVTSVAAAALLVAAGFVANVPAASAKSSPPALYTKAQATAGETLYAAQCSGCHGVNLDGNPGPGPALSGPNLKKIKLNISDMFQFVTAQMPMNAPGTLTHDQYTKIMAYVLKFNGYPAGKQPLTYAKANSSNVPLLTYK
jgi:mono/diheme cytochrome c family protein